MGLGYWFFSLVLLCSGSALHAHLLTCFPTEVPSIQDSRTRPSDPRMLSGPQVSPVAGEKLLVGYVIYESGWPEGSGDLGKRFKPDVG